MPYNSRTGHDIDMRLGPVIKLNKSNRAKLRRTFIKTFNWEGINFPSEKDDWKTIEINNQTIAPNVFHAKKRKNISCLCFITQPKSRKTNSPFNDSTWKMTLSSSKKTISIIKRNKYHGLNV